VGDKPHTQDFVEDLLHTRQSLLDSNKNKMREKDINRY